MANTSDELVNLMQGVQGDPSDPNVQKAKLNILFSRWGRPQVQPSSAPDTLDETPGAGSDGGNSGYRQASSVRGGSEQSSEPTLAAGSSPDTAEPKPANPISYGQAQRAQNSRGSAQAPDTSDAHLVPLAKQLAASGMFGSSESTPAPGSTADLESRVPFGGPSDQPNIPPVVAAAAKSAQPGGVLGVLKGIGNFAAKQILPRVGNMGYALSGHDPREMALREQEAQFQEEIEREKSDPNYLRRVAEAQTAPHMVVSPDGKGGYEYMQVDPFSGRSTPTGVGAPSPEKTPAQLLGEYVQAHPDALTKGTDANREFEEMAEALRAFPSQQAQIHANAEMYVGRLGVQRAIVQADGLIRAMQGRNISEAGQQKAAAINEEIKAAAAGWADFYTQHPYLSAMGYGPDPGSQARFMSDSIDQLNAIGLETNQLTQKIPGTAQVVPPKNQVPSIINNAVNSANRGKVATQSHIAGYARQKGISVQQAEQEFRKAGYTVIPAPMTR